MTVEALEIPTKPYTGEKARLSRAYDYLILVLALFLFIGAFHLHVALTVRAPPDQRPPGLEA